MDWDPRPGTYNPISRIQDPGTETQDQDPGSRTWNTGLRSRINNPYPGPDFCDQGLCSILCTVFFRELQKFSFSRRFFPQIKQKYSFRLH